MVVAHGDTMIISKMLKAALHVENLESGDLLHEINVLEVRETVNEHCCITAVLESKPTLGLGNESQISGLQLINRNHFTWLDGLQNLLLALVSQWLLGHDSKCTASTERRYCLGKTLGNLPSFHYGMQLRERQVACMVVPLYELGLIIVISQIVRGT